MAAVERIDKDDNRATGRDWTVLARCQGCGRQVIRTYSTVEAERADLLAWSARHVDC